MRINCCDRRKQKYSSNGMRPTYVINNVMLEEVDEIKDMGV